MRHRGEHNGQLHLHATRRPVDETPLPTHPGRTCTICGAMMSMYGENRDRCHFHPRPDEERRNLTDMIRTDLLTANGEWVLVYTKYRELGYINGQVASAVRNAKQSLAKCGRTVVSEGGRGCRLVA